MGKARWIAGFLGWVAFGPIGALLGYLAGAVFEGSIDVARQIGSGSSSGTDRQTTGGQYQRTTTNRRYTQTEQRNSFYVSLLILSSAVIKADGKTDQRELDYVVDFFRKNFGDSAAQEARQMLEKLKNDPFFMENVTAWRTVPPREARYAPWPDGIDERLPAALARHGISRLYTHQAECFLASQEGRDYVGIEIQPEYEKLIYDRIAEA